jgi:hypothetical protein
MPDELLEGLMAGGPGAGMFGPQAQAPRKKVDKDKKKNLRKMQKKSRKKGR